jgi:hypothetical protein
MLAMEKEPLESAEDLEEPVEEVVLSLQGAAGAAAASLFLPASTRTCELIIGVVEM